MSIEEDFKIISENINKHIITIDNKNKVLSDKDLLEDKNNNRHIDILIKEKNHPKAQQKN